MEEHGQMESPSNLTTVQISEYRQITAGPIEAATLDLKPEIALSYAMIAMKPFCKL